MTAAVVADAQAAPAHAPDADAARRQLRRLGALFFGSGIPALLYQLVWQRALFRIFGVNIESVTIVVAAFMLGLGLGSLAGGVLSHRGRLALLPLLAAIEGLTALFGLASLAIFERVGERLAGAPLAATAAATLALVLVPTLLMGATLPLLVGHLARRSGNVGHAVGMLYHVNTLGAASACLLAAAALFPLLGMHGTIVVAAALNAAVAAAALWLHRCDAGAGAAAAAPAPAPMPVPSPSAAAVVRLPFAALLALAAAGGFVSLSWEIFLFRVMSLASGSSPFAFAVTLGAFLVGLASGSRVAAEACERLAGAALACSMLTSVLAACAAGALMLPALAATAPAGGSLMLAVALVFVYLLARWWGVLLPALAHLGVAPDARAGLRTGWLVLANIVGSAAGSVLTGFVLTDAFGLVRLAQLLVVAGLACAAALALVAPSPAAASGRGRGAVAALALALATVAATAALPQLTPRLFEALQFRGDPRANEPFAKVVENRSGVIAVARDGTVFGHGAYDGAFSTDLVDDVNGIVRPFALSLFHPAPRDVLMIGLSSGSWAQVIASHPQLRSLTIVEINPGYAALVAAEPKVASVLRHPKVSLVTEDGRRWLRLHPDRRFDAIVTNTTFHHRANSTNLLSADYIAGLKRHLNPGGITFYNTTDSARVQRTGCLTFAHGARFMNHVVLSDAPIDWDFERWQRTLLAYRIDGRAVLDPARDADRRRLDTLLAAREQVSPHAAGPAGRVIEPCALLLARTAGLAPVTDDNMGTEWTSWRETQ